MKNIGLAILLFFSIALVTYAQELDENTIMHVWDTTHNGIVKVATNCVADKCSSGTGWIWQLSDNKLYVLTNWHVVKDTVGPIRLFHSAIGPERNECFLAGPLGSICQSAVWINSYILTQDKDNDLALLVAYNVKNTKLVSLPLAEVDPQVGQWAISIGYPLGLWESMTLGIVSGVDRHLGETVFGINRTDMWQSDVNVVPGNSGGPVLDTKGRVIGMACLSLAYGSVVKVPVGIQLMVPINHIAAFMEKALTQPKATATPQPGRRLY